jgi:endonuclease/exonuclease/phosphatase family metal-dependent hydrolase
MKLIWLFIAIGSVVAVEFAGEEVPTSGSHPSKRILQGEFNMPREVSVCPPVSGIKSIRVGTWNIDRGGELSTIEAELARHPADLLLLQEVDSHTARSGAQDETTALARRLQMNAVYAIEFEELSQEKEQHQAFIGQATLTRLLIRRSRVLRFEHQSGFWKPRSWLPSSIPLMQRRLGSRIALVTELDFAGRLLVVYNVHLESRSYGRIQAEQIDEILSDLRQYPAGTAVLFGGDLNTKYFPSIFLNKLKAQGFRSVLGGKIERTHAIAMALDWLFVRGNIEATGGEVRRDFRGSDHYPVFAEVKSE